jgi:polar amino acid transport system substrate-binding protein
LRRNRYPAILASLIAVALVAAACQPAAQVEAEIPTIEAGTLTVGSDIPFEPFEFEDEQGKTTGFDVDLIEEIAERNDLTVKWVATLFDTIFTQLAAGQFDAVASATTITEERKKQVNFTDPYYVSQQSLTINSQSTPNIASVNDLKAGDTVAVQEGTTGQEWAETNLGPRGIRVQAFPAAPDPYAALEAGSVTGVVFDYPSAIAEARNRPALKVVQEIETGELFGFAVNPENTELLDAMNKSLREIISDGTYATIYAKYPDLPPGGDITKAD